MEIYFVRHAEPDYESISYGPGSFPGPSLTDFGRKQAQGLSLKLSAISFDNVFCSDYIRTKETIEPYKEIHNKNINYEPRLREVADVINGYLDYNNFSESQESQVSRLDSFASELIQSNFRKVLIIAHFNTIEYLSRKLGKHIKQPQFAEINIVQIIN